MNEQEPRPPTGTGPGYGSQTGASSRLYDAYIEAALAGQAPDPAAFLADRTGATDAALLEALEAVRQVAGAGRLGRGLPEERVAGFRLIGRLGRGGMGVVFLAEQLSLSRLVALKVMRPSLAEMPRMRARFTREAQTLARPGVASPVRARRPAGALPSLRRLPRQRGPVAQSSWQRRMRRWSGEGRSGAR